MFKHVIHCHQFCVQVMTTDSTVTAEVLSLQVGPVGCIVN